MKAAAELPAAYHGNVEQLVFRLNGGPAPLSIEEAQPLLDRLIDANDLADARRLWIETHSDGVVANGKFEQVSDRDGADVPRAWDISDEDLATIAIQSPDFGGDGRALRISGAARSGPIVSQRLMLPSGSYSVGYRARSGAGNPVAFAGSWTVDFGCQGDLQRNARNKRKMARIQRSVRCANSGLPDPETRARTAQC